MKNIFGEDLNSKKCFYWTELKDYIQVVICLKKSDKLSDLADEYYLRGISFISNPHSFDYHYCLSKCGVKYVFYLSKEESNDPIRYVLNEKHSKAEEQRNEELLKVIAPEYFEDYLTSDFF